MGQIKFFLVALDEFSKQYKDYNFNKIAHPLENGNNSVINSPVKTMDLWKKYINENSYEIIEYLKNVEANKVDFLEKFNLFIDDLKPEDTGVFLINTHGKTNIVKDLTKDLDGKNERMLLYEDWLIDDDIRIVLNSKKDENANFIGIIDTCEATEDFNETPFDFNIVPEITLKTVKNEIFLFGSSSNKVNLNNSVGNFNNNGYSVFLYELLKTLKKDKNTTYKDWFITSKNNIVFNNLSTSQKPILINHNLDLINKKVFTNEVVKPISISTIPIICNEICLAKNGIFDGIYFNEKLDFYRTIYLENIIDVFQENLNLEKNNNALLNNEKDIKINKLELELTKNNINN